FEAEECIRVFHVTGVQTCALPIWAGGRPLHAEQSAPDELTLWNDAHVVRGVRGHAGHDATPCGARFPGSAHGSRAPAPLRGAAEIGRASWRERGRGGGAAVGGATE